MNKIKRQKLDPSLLIHVIDEVRNNLSNRLNQHGDGACVSPMETLGIVTEEYFEVVEAVKSNNNDEVYKELSDLAVSCLLGMASIQLEESLDS